MMDPEEELDLSNTKEESTKKSLNIEDALEELYELATMDPEQETDLSDLKEDSTKDVRDTSDTDECVEGLRKNNDVGESSCNNASLLSTQKVGKNVKELRDISE